jgi:hypothetical protein
MNKDRIPKLVIKPGDINTERFGLACNENLLMCYECKSPLFYIKINYGVTAEEYDYGIVNNKSKRVYALREIGFNIYCAECGSFIENYNKFFYPDDKLVFWDFMYDELDDDERAEIDCCLNQYNQKRDFKARYKAPIFNELKEKLDEYEKNHPEDDKEKIKKRKK